MNMLKRAGRKFLLVPILAVGAVLALSACGGGGSSDSSGSGGDSGTSTAPTISMQPSSVTVTEGASASLSVTATGSGTLSYQWYKDGAAISGATSATYTIGAVESSSAGSYYVVVSSSVGSATSSTVTLTVNASSGSTGDWNITTGANSSDLIEDVTFDYTLTIDLATLAISSSSTALVVGTTTSGSTPVTLDGITAVTVTQDAFGLTIDSEMPDDVHLDLALAGNYSGSVTIYSNAKFRLSLGGVNIASPDGPAINIQSGKRTFVVLGSGTTNVLSDTPTYSARTLANGDAMDLKAAFFSEGPLLFSGTGSLSITANGKHAIASDDHVRVREGSITIQSNEKDGIRANDAFVMDGGTVDIQTASGAGKGIKVDGKEDDEEPVGFIAINDGSLKINSYDKAITAAWESDEDGETATTTDDPDPRVTINGGTLDITTFGTPYEDRNTADGDDSLSPEGIEAKSVLTVNGGTISVSTTDDGLNAGTGIVVNNGRIYATSSSNDAIDSNGTLTITGGTIVAVGAGNPEGGLDCDQNTFKVTGGTFIGIGGRNSSPTRSVTTQNTVALSNGSASSLLAIKDGSGNVAFAYTIPKTSSAMLLSSPLLTTGTTYTVYSGGSLGTFSEDFHGLYLGAASHSGGTAGKSFTISSTVTTP